MPPENKPRSSKKPSRMDIRAVAQHAKVSVATVSRTINHVPTVNPKMAKRVWEAIRELRYVPNTQARALVSGKSGVFGLIVSEITNPFFSELIQGFEDVAIESGNEILVSSTNYDPKRWEQCIRRMLERKVDGVAVMTFGIEEPLLEMLAERDIPLVFIDAGPERPGISLLKVDYHDGIRQGVQHLAALGHRNIAFVSGPMRLHSAHSRLDCFQRALRECGIPLDPAWIIEGDHTLEGGMTAMAKLLQGEKLPTAVMCSNDMTAIGVLHQSYRAGLRVPDDLSIIGFDDVHMAQVMFPPLTSIRMSRVELARAAVTALRSYGEQPEPKREYQIDTQLVVRESTGFPRGAMHDLSQPAKPHRKRATRQ